MALGTFGALDALLALYVGVLLWLRLQGVLLGVLGVLGDEHHARVYKEATSALI